MDRLKYRKIFLIYALCAAVGIGTTAAFAAPGDSDDPIISKSYIDNIVIPRLTQYIENRLAGVPKVAEVSGTSQTAPVFEVVDVKKGQTLIASKGCEMILRKGSGRIIATEKGGIADTTSGYDLANGSDMPANHMLVVPLDDGRGFTALNDVIVMVKGGYYIS